MQRKGILWCAGTVLMAAACFNPVCAAESVDEIEAMMEWWDKFGSDWENARGLIELAESEPAFMLTENTTEGEQDERRQQ